MKCFHKNNYNLAILKFFDIFILNNKNKMKRCLHIEIKPILQAWNSFSYDEKLKPG